MFDFYLPHSPFCQLDFFSKKFILRMKIQLDSKYRSLYLPILLSYVKAIFFISLENVENMLTILIFCSNSQSYDAHNYQKCTNFLEVILLYRPKFSKMFVFSPKYLYIIVTKKLDVNLKIMIKIH